MNRELLVLRHAKSAWDTDARTDFDRPLARRGHKDAPRVGRFLASQGLVPDYVVSSPATRARQTVLAVCGELGIDEDEIHWERRIYGAGTSTLFQVLRECPSSSTRVLIAGHNPGFEYLVESLCAAPVPIPANGKLMPTAAVARLEFSGLWAELEPNTARLLSLIHPRSLRELPHQD